MQMQKDDQFSAYAKCSEKLKFLTPRYTHVHMPTRG